MELDLNEASRVSAPRIFEFTIAGQYWTDLMPLTKLKAGITKAKLAGLDQVFHLNPVPTPEPNMVPYLLNLMTMPELKSEAHKRGLTIPKGAKKPELVELLSASPS